MLLVYLCATFHSVTAHVGVEDRHFTPIVLHHSELKNGLDLEGKDRLSAALRGQGILSITGVPGYAEAEAIALKEAVACLEKNIARGVVGGHSFAHAHRIRCRTL